MTTQTFEVSVGYATHQVELIRDGETGRTAVRVDGRMAARPFGPHDTCREITIDGERYEVRRVAGEFELNYAGGLGMQQQLRATYYAQARKSGSSRGVWLAIGTIVIGLAAAFLYVAAPAAKSAVGIGWYRHSDPDKRFTFQMPARPKMERRTVDGSPVTAYVSSSGRLEFHLSHFDLESAPPADKVGPMINAMRDAMLRRYNAVAVHDQDTVFGSEIVARSEKSGTDIRIRIVRNGRRIYLLIASAPRGELGALAISKFFMSFRQLT